MSDNTVSATGLRRSFGAVQAVRGIDLTAHPGQVTALVGPNGAGKTTLLLVLATLLVPDGGSARVAGFDPVTESDQVRARMGWSPDVFGIYDNLTPREYLTFMAAAMRITKARGAERAAELLAVARLEDKADLPVHTLSRGQKQRLGLMRALVHDPQVLLLDEPASGLDPRSRVELRDLLRALAGQGKTLIVSSHLLADLEELSDRVVFVDKGVTVGEHAIDALPSNSASHAWRLRALDMPLLLAALGRSGVTYGDPTPAGVDVQLGGDEAAAQLLAQLIRENVPVVSCQPVGGHLEAAYLELTR